MEKKMVSYLQRLRLILSFSTLQTKQTYLFNWRLMKFRNFDEEKMQNVVFLATNWCLSESSNIVRCDVDKFVSEVLLWNW